MTDDLSHIMDNMSDFAVLTPAEERELARRMSAGDARARELMILHNMRLVVSIAKKYRNRGLPFSEVIQEGMVGLITAVDKFDHEKGYKFSTYATWWIRQSCQRIVVKNGTTIRLPLHVDGRRVQAMYYMRDNPDASLEEVAVAIKVTVKQLTDALEAAAVVASLSAPINDTGTEMIDLLIDPDAPNPEDVITLWSPLFVALDCLTDDERNLIELRFGFRDHVHSFVDAAKAMGCTTGRAQELQRSALAKLRDRLEEDGTLAGTTDHGERAELARAEEPVSSSFAAYPGAPPISSFDGIAP